MNHSLLHTRYDDADTSDEQFLESYNAATVEIWRKIDMTVALNHLLKNGVWEKLDDAASNDAYPAELRQKIRKFLTTVSSNIPELAVRDAEPETNLPVLVSLGIITQNDADEFLDLACEFVSQSFLDHGRETTQTDLNVMKNQDAIAATQQIISDAETLNSELTEAEYSRQSARSNELAALRAVVAELESGVVREVPEAPVGEAWD